MSGAAWRMPVHLRIVGATRGYAQECTYCPWRSREMNPDTETERWRATAEGHHCAASAVAHRR